MHFELAICFVTCHTTNVVKIKTLEIKTMSTKNENALTAELLNTLTNFDFDGIDFADYPDFCDARICYAEDAYGNEVSDEVLDFIHENHSDFVYEAVIAHLY